MCLSESMLDRVDDWLLSCSSVALAWLFAFALWISLGSLLFKF